VSKARILLTGVTGQLGSTLAPMLSHFAEVIAPERAELDLANPEQIESLVAVFKPDLIFNAAAYTAVDKAEQEPELAHAINATAPEVLAKAAKHCGSRMIHMSTDYVFDGQSAVPYGEQDPTGPINVYGQTKLDGELSVLKHLPDAVVVRAAWLYHIRGQNFFLTMLRLAQSHPLLRVVDDQIGAPTYVPHLANALAQLTQLKLAGDSEGGVYHLPAGGTTSWYGFAQSIFDLKQQQGGFTAPEVTGIPSSEYPTPAQRPQYSQLDGGLIQETFGITLPSWQAQLEAAIRDHDASL
jgi:dTDP-4-dehydrorhamnose reductase